jgi:hypothetical protein
LRIREDLLGQDVKCPACNQVFTASLEEHAPPPKRPEPDTYSMSRREEDDRPRRRLSRRDDEADRPRRRSLRRDYDDDDDDDDRGRRRRRYTQPHRGGLILGLGIAAFFVFSPVLGPIAWILGHNDLKEIRAGRMDREGEGLTQGGMICGMIATLLSVVVILGLCFIFGLLGAVSRRY